MGDGSGCSQRKQTLDAGERPPQNLLMLSPRLSKPELLGSFALRDAQRKPAISAPDGDAPGVLIKKRGEGGEGGEENHSEELMQS